MNGAWYICKCFLGKRRPGQRLCKFVLCDSGGDVSSLPYLFVSANRAQSSLQDVYFLRKSLLQVL